jgi:hypothetical protein
MPALLARERDQDVVTAVIAPALHEGVRSVAAELPSRLVTSPRAPWPTIPTIGRRFRTSGHDSLRAALLPNDRVKRSSCPTRLRRSIQRGDVGAPGAFQPYVVGATVTVVGVVMAALLARSLAE